MYDDMGRLVEQMVAEGEWPDPQLLDEILSAGDRAVEPLLEVVRCEVHGWPAEAPLGFAARLLGQLRAQASLRALVDLLYRYDNETLEAVESALVTLGPVTVGPLLLALRDPRLPWGPKAAAAGALTKVAADDRASWDVVTGAFVDQLSGYVERASTLTSDEIEMATELAGQLARLGVRRARGLIQLAYQRGIIDLEKLGEDAVARHYEEGLTEPVIISSWLEDYREAYLEKVRGDCEEINIVSISDVLADGGPEVLEVDETDEEAPWTLTE
ncbi:MAG: hypothetical protein HY815_14035 [Candidatus Riflebacteria bacterium]|nr:hypothetical protein [Candidatus Riflebacteria bacterium]